MNPRTGEFLVYCFGADTQSRNVPLQGDKEGDTNQVPASNIPPADEVQAVASVVYVSVTVTPRSFPDIYSQELSSFGGSGIIS
jgi:hypothetical protein